MWMFPKWYYQKLNHFSIETRGFGDPTFSDTAIFIAIQKLEL